MSSHPKRHSSSDIFNDTAGLNIDGISPRPTLTSTLRSSRFSITDGGTTTRSRRRNIDGEPIGERVFHPGLKRFAVTGAVSGEGANTPSLRGTWSATTGSRSALPSTSGQILETLARRTGWGRDDADKSYRETIQYRQPVSDDLESETWMDIVNRRGKPWIRNIGCLRYLGTTEFAPGIWAGIEIYGKSVPAGNDGSLDGLRYFKCNTGLGIFIEDKFCRRSFLQRPRHLNAINGFTADSRLKFLDDKGIWQVPAEPEPQPPPKRKDDSRIKHKKDGVISVKSAPLPSTMQMDKEEDDRSDFIPSFRGRELNEPLSKRPVKLHPSDDPTVVALPPHRRVSPAPLTTSIRAAVPAVTSLRFLNTSSDVTESQAESSSKEGNSSFSAAPGHHPRRFSSIESDFSDYIPNSCPEGQDGGQGVAAAGAPQRTYQQQESGLTSEPSAQSHDAVKAASSYILTSKDQPSSQAPTPVAIERLPEDGVVEQRAASKARRIEEEERDPEEEEEETSLEGIPTGKESSPADKTGESSSVMVMPREPSVVHLTPSNGEESPMVDETSPAAIPMVTAALTSSLSSASLGMHVSQSPREDLFADDDSLAPTIEEEGQTSVNGTDAGTEELFFDATGTLRRSSLLTSDVSGKEGETCQPTAASSGVKTSNLRPAPLLTVEPAKEESDLAQVSTPTRNICFSPKATEVVFVKRKDSSLLASPDLLPQERQSVAVDETSASVKPLASGLGSRMEVRQLNLDKDLALPRAPTGAGGDDGLKAALRRCRSVDPNGSTHDHDVDKSASHRRCRTGDPFGVDDDEEHGAKVGLHELEHYAQAARDYLEKYGVETPEALEAAAFTKRVLYCRLNNIDPSYGSAALELPVSAPPTD